jgi:hypothetical protein
MSLSVPSVSDALPVPMGVGLSGENRPQTLGNTWRLKCLIPFGIIMGSSLH